MMNTNDQSALQRVINWVILQADIAQIGFCTWAGFIKFDLGDIKEITILWSMDTKWYVVG